MGHIIRWREHGRRPRRAPVFAGTSFCSAGDPEARRPASSAATSQASVAFAQPDGLVFDARGVLWIQTDASAQNMAGADWDTSATTRCWRPIPRTGEIRRFLTGPVGCEITGIQLTPDLRDAVREHPAPRRAAAAPSGAQRSEQPQGGQLLARRRRTAAAHAPPPSPSRAPTAASSALSARRRLFPAAGLGIVGVVLEPSVLPDEGHGDAAGGAVAVLADDQLGSPCPPRPSRR